jgi:hypothetical protein
MTHLRVARSAAAGPRLTPGECRRLLPGTVLAFWAAGGFASYTEPWEWALSAVTAVMLAVMVVPYVLQRLGEWTTPPQSTHSGDRV